MISPVILSILFLIVILFIVIAWTRVILGTSTEDEEILNTLRRQISNLASMQLKASRRTIDNSIDSLSLLTSCKGADSNEKISGTCEASVLQKLNSNNIMSKIQNFRTHIKEIEKNLKEKELKKEEKFNQNLATEKRESDVSSKSYITVKVKKSPTVVNYFTQKNDLYCEKTTKNLSSKNFVSDSSYISCSSTGDVIKNNSITNLWKKEEDPKKDISPIKFALHEQKSNESLDVITSSSSSSKSEYNEIRPTKPLKRHKSLTNRTNKPKCSLRKSSSETFVQRTNNLKKKIKKNEPNYKVRNIKNNIPSSSSGIHCSNYETDTVKEKPKEPRKRKENDNIKDIKQMSNLDLSVSKVEKENILHLEREKFASNIAGKVLRSKWNETRYEIPNNITTHNQISHNPKELEQLYKSEYKKISNEFQFECNKNFEHNIEANFLTTKLNPPNELRNTTTDQQRRPNSPKKYLNARILNNLISNLQGAQCCSEYNNKQHNLTVSRSSSFDRLKTTIQNIQEANLCQNKNLYDLDLILSDAPEDLMKDILYDPSMKISEDLNSKILQKLPTSDKSVEAKRSKSKETVDLKSKSVNTSNICFTDGTQTSHPKLAVQHIQGYCEPEFLNEDLKTVDLNNIQNESNPLNLVMPNLNLVDVSKSLRKSRHEVEELVKETKTLISDQKEKQNNPEFHMIQLHPENSTPRSFSKNISKAIPATSLVQDTKYFSLENDTININIPTSSEDNKEEEICEIIEEIQIQQIDISAEYDGGNYNTKIKGYKLRSNPNDMNSIKIDKTLQNLTFSEIPRPVSPKIKSKLERSASPNLKDIINYEGFPKRSNYSTSRPQSPNKNLERRNKSPAQNYSEIPRPVSPNPRNMFEKQKTIIKTKNQSRNPSPVSKVATASRYPFGEGTKSGSPNNLKRNPENKTKNSNLSRPNSPKQPDIRNRSVSPCNIPIPTGCQKPRSPRIGVNSPPRSPNREKSSSPPPCSLQQNERIDSTVPKNEKSSSPLSYLPQQNEIIGLQVQRSQSRIRSPSRTQKPSSPLPFITETNELIDLQVQRSRSRIRYPPKAPKKEKSLSPVSFSCKQNELIDIQNQRSRSKFRSPLRVLTKEKSPPLFNSQQNELINMQVQRSRSKIRSSPRVLKKERSPSPLSNDLIDFQVQRSLSKSPARHEIGCSTSKYNSSHISTQCQETFHTSKTRWIVNPELKKYQSYDYNCPREKYFSSTPNQSMPPSNFYQVTDFCKHTPYLNRALSPLPNPANMRAENLRKIIHAKDIATRINR